MSLPVLDAPRPHSLEVATQMADHGGHLPSVALVASLGHLLLAISDLDVPVGLLELLRGWLGNGVVLG